MRYIITLLSCSFLYSISFSQYNGIFFGFPGNKADVLQVNNIHKEYVYVYTYNRKGVKDSALKKINYFNQSGDLIETEEPDKENILVSSEKNIYTYNSNNDIIKIVHTGKWSSQPIITEYEYDSLSNITGIYNYPADTSRLNIENREYDKNENLVSITTTLNLDPPFVSKKYTYLKDSTIKLIQSYNTKGELQYSDIHEFDSTTNSKSIYLDNHRGRELKSILVYDNQKRVIKELSDFQDLPTFFKVSGLISSNNSKKMSEHLYNTNGTLLETNIYLDGKKVQTYRHFYE